MSKIRLRLYSAWLTTYLIKLQWHFDIVFGYFISPTYQDMIGVYHFPFLQFMTKKNKLNYRKKFGLRKNANFFFGNCKKGLQNWGFSLHDRLHSWYPGACFVIGFLNAIWLFWSGFHDGFFPWWAWSPQRQLVPAMLNTEKYTSLVVSITWYILLDTVSKR